MARRKAQAQWVERDWTGGLSFDEFVGPAGSFYYSNNMDVRNNLKCMQLRPKVSENSFPNPISAYFSNLSGEIWKFTNNGDVYNVANNLIGNIDNKKILDVVRFRDKIIAVSEDARVYDIDGLFSFTDITPTTDITGNNPFPTTANVVHMVNYYDGKLLLGINNELWSWDGNTTSTWTLAQQYSGGGAGLELEIVGLTTSGDGLRVYVTDGEAFSRQYFLPAPFTITETSQVQTVDWNGMVIDNVGQYGRFDYVLAYTGGAAFSGVTRLHHLYITSGYDRTLIRSTRSNAGVNEQWDTIFSNQGNITRINQNLSMRSDMLYVPMEDAVYSYGNAYSGVQKSISREFNALGNPTCVTVTNDTLYVAYDTGEEQTTYLGFRSNDYEEQSEIISRVFAGDLMSDQKETVGLSVGYEIPPQDDNPGTIDVYVRYNMNVKELDDGWQLVRSITDTERHSVNIPPTDMYATKWDTMQYRIVINRGSPQWSPKVYDHALFYNIVEQQ